MLACHCRSLLLGQDPAQVLGACHAGALCVRVERRHHVLGHVPNEDISHARYDIARGSGRSTNTDESPAEGDMQAVGDQQHATPQPHTPAQCSGGRAAVMPVVWQRLESTERGST